jgi:hypothetical protein
MKLSRLRSFRVSRASAAWVAALTAAGALEVWLHLQTTELGYQLSMLHHLNERLVGERRELEMELATLKTPQSLDSMAKARLRLRPPQEGQIVGLP